MLGLPAVFWLNLEAHYRSQLQKAREENELQGEINFAKRLPYAEMAELQWVERVSNDVEQVRLLRKFFEVARLEIIDDLDVFGDFLSQDGMERERYSLLAWLQQAKHLAPQTSLNRINRRKLRSLFSSIRELTGQKPEVFCPSLRDMLVDCGISLVFLPALGDLDFDCISFKAGKKQVLGITLGDKSSDTFWMQLLGELYGLMVDAKETYALTEEVRQELRDILVPRQAYDTFVGRGHFAREAILAFVKEEGLDAGLVAACLQEDGKITEAQYQELQTIYHLEAC